MRKIKKIAALLLVMSMVFSSSGLTTLAAEDVATAGSEAVTENADKIDGKDQVNNPAESEENMAGQVPADNSEAVDAGQAADSVEVNDDTKDTSQELAMSEITEKQKAFEYVYVDEQVVNVPEDQNIVVAFADSELVLESATLHYSMAETGMTYDMPASNIVKNTVLFTKSYTDAAEAGQYQIDSITYRIAGQTEDTHVDFSEQEVTAGYTVTTEQEVDAESVAAETPEVKVYSMDDAGNTVEQSGEKESIAATVENVLSAADESAAEEVSPKARTLEKAENKVIVICAGHDATHTGASGNGLREEQLTWKVANYCKEELEKYAGVTVYLDRSSVDCAYPGKDRNYCLNQRIKDAAAKGATVFVDIHFNSVNGVSTTANGAEIYYPNKSYDSAIHQDGANLANNILSQLTALGLTNRGAKIKDANTEGGYVPEYDKDGNIEDYFTTNNESKALGMTGIIVEHAFLDNAGDAAKLKDEAFIKKLGVADAKGIANTYGLGTVAKPTYSAECKLDDSSVFSIKATNLTPSAGQTVKAAIWSDKDGQDDLAWYTLDKVSEGTYQKIIDIKNHKNTMGIYYIDFYYVQSGKPDVYLNTVICDVKKLVTGCVVQKVGGMEKQFEVLSTIANSPVSVKQVRTAVWSDKNGQDDLCWYTATKTAESTWRGVIDIKNHKTTGKYFADTYVDYSNGSTSLLKSVVFNVTDPSIGKVEFKNLNVNAGTFDVVISGTVAPAGVNQIRVPVWSKADQSDLYWYTAAKQSDGTYKVTVNKANHKNSTGTYTVHVYLTDGNGIEKAVDAGKMQMQETQKPEMNVEVKDRDNTQKVFDIKVYNPELMGSIQTISSAVWSDKGGQDDLRWYTLSKNSSGIWTAAIPISQHRTSGKYFVDTYATLTNGTQKFVKSIIFTVTDPAIGKVEFKNVNGAAGTFDVVISGIVAPAGVSQIKVPVWCKADQSDLYWYTATKQSDGTYKVTVNKANHKNAAGTYTVHVYLTDGNGIEKAINVGTQKLDGTTKPEMKIEVVDRNNKQMIYDVKVSNPEVQGTIQSISSAVWSDKNGQDDLRWYPASKDASGTWVASISILQHKTVGTYFVDTYATLTNGTSKYLKTSVFTVTDPQIGKVEFKNSNWDKGTFDVVISGTVAPSGVQEMRVPVWTKADQSDLKWYTATKQNDGTYKVTVNIANHNNAKGIYNVHVYMTTENGFEKAVNAGTFELKQSGDVEEVELYDIMGTSTVTKEQMVSYFKASASYPSEALEKGGAPDIETFCQIILEEAAKENVRAEVVLTQSMKETAWLRFGGIVKIEQFNFCGLGATDVNGEVNSAWFKDVREGIRAQVQHLKAYASTEPLNEECVDPRFDLVRRGAAPYVQWLGKKENPTGAGWATAEKYGYQIVDMINALKTK